ncbi:hypothetical protein [Mangrovicella endophytica]|uniref:hypothetical protein n=1 Tax=Mangrovicella endophytica TaxID=2066697 RepID=UPI001FDF70A9|nr:hypothetical protein [Mangrovicella endophytica]
MRPAIPFALAAAVLLSGCTTMSPQERRAADEETCRGYGFKPRTNGFAECLQRIDLDREADRRARRYGGRYDGPGFGVVAIGGYERW